MRETIMIGVDNAPGTASTLALAATIARGRDATMVLAPCRAGIDSTIRANLARDLDDWGGAVTIAEGTSDSCGAFLDAAARHKASLIVLPIPPGGDGRLDGFGAAIVRASPLPVLAFRPGRLSPGQPGTILVPFVDSPHDGSALQLARLLARTTGATLTLMRVLAPSPGKPGQVATRPREALFLRGAEAVLDLLVLDLLWEGIPASGRVAVGPLVPTVVDTVAQVGADLIVMGADEQRCARWSPEGDAAAALMRATERAIIVMHVPNATHEAIAIPAINEGRARWPRGDEDSAARTRW